MIDRRADDEAHMHPAERGMDRAMQARLAYRIQHIEGIRTNRRAREGWEQEMATRAREEYASRSREHSEPDDPAQRRLHEFYAREMAARASDDKDASGGMFGVPVV